MTNHPNRSKTAQFHEGQDVEVWFGTDGAPIWHKAKIANRRSKHSYYIVFPDSTRAVFDAAHIRASNPIMSVAECADYQWPLARE